MQPNHFQNLRFYGKEPAPNLNLYPVPLTGQHFYLEYETVLRQRHDENDEFHRPHVVFAHEPTVALVNFAKRFYAKQKRNLM